MQITELLTDTLKHNASDLHLSSGLIPMLRIDGELHSLPYAVTTVDQVYSCIFATMNATQRQMFEAQLDMDYMFILSDGTRFSSQCISTLSWSRCGFFELFLR